VIFGVFAAFPDTGAVTTPGGSDLEVTSELVRVVQRLSLARSVVEIQEIVRTAARRLTNADGATFILREAGQCYYVDEDAIAPLWKGSRFPLDECISGWTMLNRSPVVIEDIYADERIPHDAYRPTFVTSLAMVPIRQLNPVGAIGNYWANHHRADEREVALLQALADSTAVALENVRAYQEAEQARLETVRRLARAAEYRDEATHRHTERVAEIAYRLATQMGMAPASADLLREAAPLHDLGKIAVPDAILLKPGKLNSAEWEQVRRHAEAGAAILAGSTSEILALAREIMLTHHEWWDGHGYPTGLKGDDIPLSGRIVALADVFDALTHARPYKPAWSVEDASEEICGLNGTQFDPAVVNAFRELDPHSLVEPCTAEERVEVAA
jgi:response regulator RpfG family c-di-GMP phosphodiesterase